MDSIISTFHIDWKIIIAQTINFAVVFAVLYIFALKPLSKLMKERSEKISKGVSDAETNAHLLEETRKEYEAALVKARNDANKIFQEGKKEAEAKKAEMMENARKEVALSIENGKKMLQTEKEKMVAEAKKEIVDLTMKSAEKLLGGKVSEFLDEKTVKEFSNL
jgi:F-type H+-transporting ATPase subunit b